jgi:hypothetical protein
MDKRCFHSFDAHLSAARNRAYHVMTGANSESDPFVGSKLNATDLTGIKKAEKTDPKNGAIRAVQLVLEGLDGVMGTYSEKEGPLP